MSQTEALIAVDAGNSRLKLGLFFGDSPRLPQPRRVLELDVAGWQTRELKDWLADSPAGKLKWVICSVCRSSSDRLVDWVQSTRSTDRVAILTHDRLSLEIALPAPQRVGIDRLVAAVAANRLRDPQRSAVVIDVGSAMTIDLVSADGVFRGGAILPGIGMSARALHQQTEALPEIAMHKLAQPPPVLGRSTLEAIESGLFWGALGAIREISGRLAPDPSEPPDVFLTGGAARSVAELLGPHARHQPHFILSGIAITASAGAL